MTSETPPQDPALAKAARAWRVRMVVSAVMLAAIFVGGSGRLGWVAAYAYIALSAASQMVIYTMLKRISPDLLVQRTRSQPGTKTWDKIIPPLITVLLMLIIIIPALDTRFGWSRVSWPWQAAGWVIIVLGLALVTWAMAVNRFFVATVRIQRERGHRVVSEGPYAYVRHPGYVGFLAYMAGTALALDSTWALVPAGICAAVIVVRTALEDRTLRNELEGYVEYAARVRWRLVPGVW